MRRLSAIASFALISTLLPGIPASAAPGDPELTPEDGALVHGLVPAHAQASESPVTELTLDDMPLSSRPVLSGEPFEFVFEGDGLNARYINGIEIGGHEVYTLDGVSGFDTVALPVEAAWLTPGDNEITLFTGTRPGICNMDDFTVHNARLRLPDGTEVYDDAHPADEETTLGDGTCGSNTSRPREVSYTFTIPDDAGTGPLGRVAELDTGAIPDGPHDVTAATEQGGSTTHTVWTDDTLTDPDEVPALLAEASPAAEHVVEAEQLLPPVAQDISVAEQHNCCSVRFGGDGQLLAGQDGDDFDPPEDGSSFTLDVPVPASGRYDVALDVTNAPDYGTFTVSVNGTQLGESYDAYADTVGVDRRVVFGTTDLDAGIAKLTVTVTGTNPASDGRLVGIDTVRLQPVPMEQDILSPADGAAVRGQVPVVGYTADTHPRAVLIDGESVGSRQLLGGQSASLVYEGGGGNGLQNAFANRISVRGQEFSVQGTVQNWTEDAVDIPSELLQPGENTVTFIAGLNNDCNHDDFDLRNVRLELPDGTVLTDPTVEGQTVVFGDGVCDSSVGGRSKALEYGFTFTIPEPSDEVDYQPGMGTVWDTTAVDDGEHTVTLEHRDGTSTTNTVVVDNTDPEIVSTVPADGSELKGTVTLAVDAADATSGVANTQVTIDGEEYPVGEALSSDDLEDGEHEMVVTVTDEAGNETSTTVSFSSIAESPDVEVVSPENGATDVSTSPSLEVRAVDPAGDPLSVSFFAAALGEPTADGTWNGASDTAEAGGLDATRGTPVESVESALQSDDVYLDSLDTGDVPYQRFDLPVPDESANLDISWEGTIHEAREIVLSAYDMTAGQWQELDRRRGDVDDDLRIQVPVTEKFVDDGVVHVLLQGTDPFADDIEDVPDEEFRDPDTYDFSLAWMTDTQYLSEGAVAGGPADDRFADAYRSMTAWIADNADERKIEYVAHTGDIIENWITIENETEAYEATAREEFGFASETMAVLENAGIPYGVTPGNHDNKFGTANELFNELFPPSRFEEASQTAKQDYFGGAWREDDYQNHYDLFSAGGQDFIVVYLGFIAGDEEIAWANEVLQEHADRNAIFATHEYLMPSMNADGRDGRLSNENQRSQGVELFEGGRAPE